MLLAKLKNYQKRLVSSPILRAQHFSRIPLEAERFSVEYRTTRMQKRISGSEQNGYFIMPKAKTCSKV